jgi:hypothetical protein
VTYAWNTTTTSATSTYALNGTWTTGLPVYVTGPALNPSPPRPQTALEWLDAEIEAMCARGRLSPV